MSTKKLESWFKRTVTVTEKNIAKAKKLVNDMDAAREQSCPIALALRGLKLRKVFVTESNAAAAMGGRIYYADLPKAAVNFIAKFDAQEERAKVKPFSFKLKFIFKPGEE